MSENIIETLAVKYLDTLDLTGKSYSEFAQAYLDALSAFHEILKDKPVTVATLEKEKDSNKLNDRLSNREFHF